MKTLHIILILIGIGIAGSAGLAYRLVQHVRHLPDTDPWSTDSLQWKAQVLQQSRRSQRLNGGVVFLGDSLTVGLTTSNIAPRTENFGIGGDTIDGLIKRLPLYDLSAASAIVVQIGINNWPKDHLAHFSEKYRQLLTMLPPGVPITAVSLTPTNATLNAMFTGNRFPSAMVRANVAIAQACAARPGCEFVDISRALADRRGELRPRYDVGDGLHLSSVAYDLWERSVANRLIREHVTTNPAD